MKKIVLILLIAGGAMFLPKKKARLPLLITSAKSLHLSLRPLKAPLLYTIHGAA
jgi:hypothetical protein